MKKKAVRMKIYPEFTEEYKKRHDQLWPEMSQMLKDHGALSYSIFLDETTHELFAYLEIEEEEKWSQTAETEINRKWWDYMADIMETNPDNSPVQVELKPVFDLFI